MAVTREAFQEEIQEESKRFGDWLARIVCFILCILFTAKIMFKAHCFLISHFSIEFRLLLAFEYVFIVLVSFLICVFVLRIIKYLQRNFGK